MSVSDPLLKQLKDHIFDLRRHCLVLNIDDANGLLLPFCTTLELIFRKGLIAQKNTALGSFRRDYWNVFFSMLHLKRQDKLPLRLAASIQTVKEFKKVQTSQGKGRLLLRVLLKRRLLKTAVTCVLQSPSLTAVMYNPSDSILGNEILSEILLSLLHEVDKIPFSLSLRNATFLDETWHLGLYRSFEFVPCDTLGISIGFAAGIPVVTQVEEGSVAGEDDKIQVGDVLDDLYGEALKGRKRGTISTLLDHFKGMPVYISVIKSYQSDGTPYPPVSELLRRLRLSPPHEKSHSGLSEINSPDLFPETPGASGLPVNTPHESAAYAAVYIGKTYVGSAGHVLEIEKAIRDVAFTETDTHVKYRIPVWVDVSDCYFKVFSRLSKEILLEKHFTEIASCGKSSTFPCIFAVVAGETTCTVSKHFYSYVFQVKQPNICQTILCTIAQGFTRTSWSV
uniref:Putative run domain-containing protein n=1 Tax=Hyalomma excavatum TaxID=257692 RepID=A0A131XIL3_9ACAR